MEKKKLDLIFCQVNKHKPNMVFETFLQVLTKIAEHKYPNRYPSQSLQKLLSIHMLPLYE
jgi:hypothetical protein